MIVGTQCMAGILDQNDSVLATERTDLFEIAGLSGQMYSNQRFWKGVGAHSLLQFLIQCHYIEVTGSRVNVDKIKRWHCSIERSSPRQQN